MGRCEGPAIEKTVKKIEQDDCHIHEGLPDFARIIEHAPNLVYVFDHRSGSNVYANRSIGDMLGYSKAEVQRLGSNLITSLIHPADLPRVLAHFDIIRNLGGEEIAPITYRVRHRSGAWLWLFSQDTVFARDADGVVTHHIGTASDITAQKQAEETALRAEATANATNEELMAFSYAMSHDMKAPSNTLGLILSELRLSLGDMASKDAMALLALADHTVARMKTLVDDTLGYAQAIDAPVEKTTVNLDAVFANVHKLLRADLRHYDGQLSATPLPHVKGIETQLFLLLQNLIQNALKFHRPGLPPSVHVSATQPDAEGTVVLSVTDNGIGIPFDKQTQVFRLFKRLANEQCPHSSGIGLATCRRIAMNHGTEVSLRSKPDAGSTFSIRLQHA